MLCIVQCTSWYKPHPDSWTDKLCSLVINIKTCLSGCSDCDSIEDLCKHPITTHTDHPIIAMEREGLEQGEGMVGMLGHYNLLRQDRIEEDMVFTVKLQLEEP